MLETLGRDLKSAVRFLLRNRMFAGVAVIALALGIGANTVVFSAAYSIILKPLPFAGASHLVAVRTRSSADTASWSSSEVSMPAADDISRSTRSLVNIARLVPSGFVVTGGTAPDNVTGLQVSGEWFGLYGVAPALGRVIGAADTNDGRSHVVVLSHAVWTRDFGGDAGVIGRTMWLATQPDNAFYSFAPAPRAYTVIGVMPSRQSFPVDGDLWVPFVDSANRISMGSASSRAVRNVQLLARLRPGVSVAQANEELRVISENMARAHPDSDRDRLVSVVALHDAMTSRYRQALLFLLGAVTFVLVLTCVSVCSLVVARNQSRRQEMAIRQALGASQGRLIRQQLVESVLLSAIGGSVGLLLATWGLRLIQVLSPRDTPHLDELGLSGAVLAYTTIVSMVAGLGFGIVPAIRLTQSRLGAAMKDLQGRMGTARSRRFRHVLVTAQIAVTVPLVLGSVLTMRSFGKLTSVELGYLPADALAVDLRLSHTTCRTATICKEALDQIVRRLDAMPGVLASAITGSRPFGMTFGATVAAAGTGKTAAEGVDVRFVSPEYFRSLSIPLIAGRTFDNHDAEHAAPVVIVNATLSRLFDGAAIGARCTSNILRDETLEIVGEVGDTRDMGLASAARPVLYVPLAQAPFIPRPTLIVRTAPNAPPILPGIREALAEVDHDAPLFGAETLEQLVSDDVAAPRLQTALLGGFAALGLLLAVTGTYGLIAYNVRERRREFGIRTCLGASRHDIIRLVLREGSVAVVTGLTLGTATALALGRFLRSFLYDVTPTDPAMLLLAVTLVAFAGFAAYGAPARIHAGRNPMRSLREE